MIVILALSGIAVGMVYCFAWLNPPKDSIAELNYPSEFFCDSGENRIDFQSDDNCAAYAAAYVLRSLDDQTDCEELAPEIKRLFGFVPAQSIVRVFEKHGFSARAYHGDTDTLKQRLTGGVPVIVFISVPNDTHYAVAVGYDTQYFYLVASLPENKNAEEPQYNRRLTTEEFEKIWRTDTILSDNVYIVSDIDKKDFNAMLHDRGRGLMVADSETGAYTVTVEARHAGEKLSVRTKENFK